MVSEKVSVSVSKNFGIKKVSVSKFFGIDKSIGTCFGKKLVSKKVSDSVSKKNGIGKKFRIRFCSDFGFRHTLNRRDTGSVTPNRRELGRTDKGHTDLIQERHGQGDL